MAPQEMGGCLHSAAMLDPRQFRGQRFSVITRCSCLLFELILNQALIRLMMFVCLGLGYNWWSVRLCWYLYLFLLFYLYTRISGNWTD